MTISYDTEELTVSRRITNLTVRRHITGFAVRGRSGRAITGAILAEDQSAILSDMGDLILY